MTKPRPPLTAWRALIRIAALIGYDGCATVTDKTESTIRKYADPDVEWEISFRDAIRLDLAYRRAGGEGAPLFETYAARLELDLVEAAPGGIVNAVRAATRESGEAADAALGLAILEGRKADAIREVSEAIAAWMGLLKQVQAMKGAPHA